MKKKFLKLFSVFALASLLGSFFIVPAIAGSGRDCDGNAVIYCGALSTSELNSKLTHGTGKSHQSAKELTALFSRFGYKTSDAGSLKTGYVTKDGRVVLGGKTIASNIKSMGRHKTTHSTQVSGISYPLYLRPPSDSFLSSSIPAFVALNYDGSFRYAIIKSCGNIVPGTLKTKPATYDLTVRKWDDRNADKHKQSTEPYLSGWVFKITGNGVNSTLTTASNGSVTKKDLKPGRYTITETQKSGWESTTGLTRTVDVRSDQIIYFGNRRIIRPLSHNLTVQKFNDLNGNSTRDSNEPLIPGWQFRVTGTGYDQTHTTESSGSFTRSLTDGEYTVTEITQNGWRATTPTTLQVSLVGTDRTVLFGNAQVVDRTHNLTVRKWNDINGDQVRQGNEPYLPNWTFRLSGTSSATAVTDAAGTVIFRNLANGSYAVSETQQEGWRSTTGESENVVFEDSTPDRSLEFGNQLIPNERVQIRLYKFEDRNNDRIQNPGEPMLAGWSFKVTGDGVDSTITTNAAGYAELTGLNAGTYTISEVLQDGWINTTGIEIEREVSTNIESQVFIFGNRPVETTPVPTPTPSPGPTPGPTPGPLPNTGPGEMAGAMAASMSLSGGAIAWIRSKKNLRKALRK